MILVSSDLRGDCPTSAPKFHSKGNYVLGNVIARSKHLCYLGTMSSWNTQACHIETPRFAQLGWWHRPSKRSTARVTWLDLPRPVAIQALSTEPEVLSP